MAQQTELERILSSISWQLKRIADSLENIEDNVSPDNELNVDEWLEK